ncbi:MAG TPA: DNA-processing protein DprA [Acetobacteraceae bacterium]|nr:DNA-processing protein DprA [Acetobacteraceae bacterium]
MTPEERLDRFRLARTPGVGPVTYRRLLARYGSGGAAIDALPGLARAGGRATPPAVPGRDDCAREIDRLARMGGRILLLDDTHYPSLLARLDDAPPAISVLGDPSLLALRSVAVVGGRNASANGIRVAELLAADLARAGLVVVSGLARGVDGAAHQGALRSGRTVAAIAGGLDNPYPPEHAELQARIAESGAVVAEAPLGTAPQSRHFPRRNRIIAGLALGVVVVEAAARSGSLITARLAQELGRELFAVPGSPLDPRSRGSNDLLRQGAWLTEQASDVLENLPEAPRETPERLSAGPPTGLAEPEPVAAAAPPADAAARLRTEILELLGPAPSTVDDIVRRCQFSAAAVMAVLLELELAGRVEALPGNRVALIRDEGD